MASGSSPANHGLLESVPDVSITSAMIGMTTAIPSNKAVELFGNDHARVATFRTKLASAIAATLRGRGVPVRGTSANSLHADLYGGTFEIAGGPSKVFFSIHVWLDDGRECGPGPGQTLLGVTDDATLEQELIRTAVGVVESFLGNRPAVGGP